MFNVFFLEYISFHIIAMVTPIMSTIDSPNHKIDKQTKCPQKGIISSRSTDSTQSLNYKNDVNCSNNDHHMKNNNINGSSLSLKKDTNDMDLQLSLKKKSNINRRQNSLGSTNSVSNGGNGGDSTSDGDGNISEDMETPPIIPPVMERPLQTISYLKSNANVSTSNSTTNIQNGNFHLIIIIIIICKSIQFLIIFLLISLSFT